MGSAGDGSDPAQVRAARGGGRTAFRHGLTGVSRDRMDYDGAGARVINAWSARMQGRIEIQVIARIHQTFWRRLRDQRADEKFAVLGLDDLCGVGWIAAFYPPPLLLVLPIDALGEQDFIWAQVGLALDASCQACSFFAVLDVPKLPLPFRRAEWGRFHVEPNHEAAVRRGIVSPHWDRIVLCRQRHYPACARPFDVTRGAFLGARRLEETQAIVAGRALHCFCAAGIAWWGWQGRVVVPGTDLVGWIPSSSGPGRARRVRGRSRSGRSGWLRGGARVQRRWLGGSSGGAK